MNHDSSHVLLSVVIVAETPSELHTAADAWQGLPAGTERIVVEWGPDEAARTAAVARNVGIRQARGQFVLATNAGVYPSPSMLKALSECPLKDDSLYRANVLEVSEHG